MFNLKYLTPQEVPQKDLELEEAPMELGGEQGRWEEERLKTASLSFGAKKEREQGMRREQERYQLLLEEDEMIDFVSTAITMKGTLTEKVPFWFCNWFRNGCACSFFIFFFLPRASFYFWPLHQQTAHTFFFYVSPMLLHRL